MVTEELGLLFLLGLAGSAHCLGMCGGFVLGAAGAASGGRAAGRVLLYHLGKLATYVFLGAVAGRLGHLAAGFGVGQRALALGLGALLVLMGLEGLGLLRRLLPHLEAWGFAVTALLRPLLGGRARPGSRASAFLIGLFNGFLPCGLVYAALAAAAASGDAARGMLGMAAFGLGTWPALAALGFAGGALAPRVRLRLRHAGAVLMLGLGLVTIGRGAILSSGPACHEAPHGRPAKTPTSTESAPMKLMFPFQFG